MIYILNVPLTVSGLKNPEVPAKVEKCLCSSSHIVETCFNFSVRMSGPWNSNQSRGPITFV